MHSFWVFKDEYLTFCYTQILFVPACMFDRYHLERTFDAEQSAEQGKFVVLPGVDEDLDERRRLHNGLSDLLRVTLAARRMPLSCVQQKRSCRQ